MKVVIIGAGIAGLTAAATLYHNGVKDLVVLEAQNYIGGRIKAELVDGKNIDIGAQYLHGRVGNPLYSIAEALGILEAEEDGEDESEKVTSEANSAGHFRVCSNGQQANGKEIISCQKYIQEIYNSTDPATLDDEVTAAQIYRQAFNDYLTERGANLSSTTRQLLEASFRSLCTYARIDEGVNDLNELSGWAPLMYCEFEGKHGIELHGGMTPIVQAILDLLPDGVVYTKSPVIGINWNQEVDLGHESDATVICENGKSFQASHVLITMSLGCLMKSLSMFEPPLPALFTTTLKGLQLGVTGKIYLQWESPFWDRDELIAGMKNSSMIDFLWLESCPVKINSDKSKKSTRFGKPWWEGSVGFDLISSHDNVLEFWFTGDQVEVLEHLSDDEVTSVLHELLEIFLDKPNIPKPIGIYRSRWHINPYVRGTYTYPTKAFHKTDVDILSKPIPSMQKPTILFAGEAFCLEAIGTAHGAYMSGESKAEIILKAMSTDISKWANVVDLIRKKHHSN